MATLFNNIDYRADKNKHQILNLEKIAVTSKYAGIEPKIVFKNLYIHTAYNLEHQVTIAQELADKIESNPDIKLLAIRNLTKFILTAEDGGILKKVLSILQQACTKK
jgi:RecA/RadA recombinase